MTNDFEVSREPDDFEPESPDPEEPATWQSEGPRDAETDELDWADQHAVAGVPSPEEEVLESDEGTASRELDGPD